MISRRFTFENRTDIIRIPIVHQREHEQWRCLVYFPIVNIPIPECVVQKGVHIVLDNFTVAVEERKEKSRTWTSRGLGGLRLVKRRIVYMVPINPRN